MRWLAVAMLVVLAGCAANNTAPGSSVGRPAAAAAQAAAQPPRAARRPAPPTTWRVTQEGTTGCADPAALRRLREPASGAEALRGLAAVRVAGGCVTVFPGQSWRLVERGTDIVRLAPVTPEGAPQAGGTGPLHFWRDQVVEERGG
jgi:hypothetical protein